MTVPDLPGAPDAASPPDFPIEWADPSDAELTWEWDDMHMPVALTPLAIDYCETLASGFAYRYRRLGLPAEVRTRIWHGYAYFAYRLNVPEAEQDAVDQRSLELKRAHAEIAAAYWRDEALPQLRAAYDWIASQPVEELEPEQLVEAWEGAWQRTGRAWEIHFYAIAGPYQILEDLAELYESIVEGAAPGEALRLTGGSVDDLQRVERDLEALAADAARIPAVAERILAPPVPGLDELSALPGGTEFVGHVRRFLEAHGHLGQHFDDFTPSWSERPELLLGDVAKRVRQPATSADERRARLAAEADELADAVRARLADRPEELERFESTLARAREIGHLTETHNYWIDRMAPARLRAFVLRVGRRLVAAGVLDDPADILFLRRADVPGLLMAPEDRRSLVAERRAEYDRQRAMKPPPYVGRPPAAAGPPSRFDGARFDADADGTLRGTGASAGVARGTARVVLGPSDFARVHAGDIIVAPSSNPSWVPLFAIAGGLVTNTGGVLSHAAVVAREFALPAVVGLGDATTRIADGRTVELDGTTGVVRLL